MPIQIVHPEIERYMRALQERHDDPVVLAMEKEAAERNFPIVNRLVGVTLEILARAIRARRVFELGSGYGYSAYWFARAVGAGGEVHCSDGDAENERKAEEYLRRAQLWERIRFHVGDAVEQLASVPGEFDIVYNDIDKQGYPAAWEAARERIRVGGLYICDNVLWYGRVAEGPPRDDPRQAELTDAITRHNRTVSADARYLTTILPTRDGVLVAFRLS